MQEGMFGNSFNQIVMTQEEKAKAYDEALERAKAYHRNELAGSKKEMMEYIFPELAESEDERIRRTLVEYFGPKVQLDFVRGIPIQKIRDWLEKQKEQKPNQSEEEREYVKTLKELVSDFIRDSGGGISDVAYYQRICDWLDERHIEQKPAWSEDIIRKAVKEIGLTQHQIDWFKTNVFPPKQEWSEEDEKMLTDISWAIRYCAYDDKKKKRVHDWFINRLESLRPPFKPSEEQMGALRDVITMKRAVNEFAETKLRELYDQLMTLKEND